MNKDKCDFVFDKVQYTDLNLHSTYTIVTYIVFTIV